MYEWFRKQFIYYKKSFKTIDKNVENYKIQLIDEKLNILNNGICLNCGSQINYKGWIKCSSCDSWKDDLEYDLNGWIKTLFIIYI